MLSSPGFRIVNECTGLPLDDVTYVRLDDVNRVIEAKRLDRSVFKPHPCRICLVLRGSGEQDFDESLVQSVINS
jgi:hypothetical protein